MRRCWSLSTMRFLNIRFEVVRYDLPYRQDRAKGPPRPGDAARDREGLRAEISKIREKHPDQVWLGGHSYGGRQCSMLAAEEPGLVDRLLFSSYPLHPPGKARAVANRTFSKLKTPALFAHGSRDPFGSIDEIKSAIVSDSSASELLEIEGVGHDLGRNHASVADKIVAAFLGFNGQQHQPDPKRIGQQQVRDLHPNRRQQKQVDGARAQLRQELKPIRQPRVLSQPHVASIAAPQPIRRQNSQPQEPQISDARRAAAAGNWPPWRNPDETLAPTLPLETTCRRAPRSLP